MVFSFNVFGFQVKCYSAEEVQTICRITSLHFVCLYVCSNLYGIYALHVRLGGKNNSLSPPILSRTQRENQPSRDITVDISVNTSNCFPAQELVSVNPAQQSLLFDARIREFYLSSWFVLLAGLYQQLGLENREPLSLKMKWIHHFFGNRREGRKKVQRLLL